MCCVAYVCHILYLEYYTIPINYMRVILVCILKGYIVTTIAQENKYPFYMFHLQKNLQ